MSPYLPPNRSFGGRFDVPKDMVDKLKTHKIVKVHFDQETHEADMEQAMAREVEAGWQVVSAYSQTISEPVEGFSIAGAATYIIFGR